MTRATAVRWPESGECSLIVKDHATGSSTVCAAVSGLVYALAGYLLNDEAVKMEVMRLDPGDAELRWSGGDEGTLAAFQTTCIGLLQVEKAHPEYLQVRISKNI